MNNLNFIYPEIFISLGIMFVLILGVFKKKSSNLVFVLSIFILLISLGFLINFPSNKDFYLFNDGYKIDQLSIFMKIVTIVSGIFVVINVSIICFSIANIIYLKKK